jgi:DNA polymerase-4
VAVGGNSGRGVVASASYEAREQGVHSAMSTRMAKAACPELIVVEPDFEWYHTLSLEMIAALAEKCDVIEPVSIDESYFGLSSLAWPQVEEFATTLRAYISERVGIAVSVGMAPSRAVAKMASGAAKPAGISVVRPENVVAWLRPQRVSKISGIGPAATKALSESGIATIGDVLENRDAVVTILGEDRAAHLISVASGTSSNVVGEITQRQSIGSETTLDKDAMTREVFGRALAHVAKESYGRLVRSTMGARGVSVKIRTGDFKEFSISSNWGRSRSDAAILDEVRALANRCWERAGGSVRLVGVTFNSLDEEVQLTFGTTDSVVRRRCEVGQVVTHHMYGEGIVVWCSGESAIVRFAAGVKTIANASEHFSVVA